MRKWIVTLEGVNTWLGRCVEVAAPDFATACTRAEEVVAAIRQCEQRRYWVVGVRRCWRWPTVWKAISTEARNWASRIKEHRSMDAFERGFVEADKTVLAGIEKRVRPARVIVHDGTRTVQELDSDRWLIVQTRPCSLDRLAGL